MAVRSTWLPLLRRLLEHALRLHPSVEKISCSVAKADDRPPNRRRSFERLHETSEDLWKARDSARTAIPSTIITISRAALQEKDRFGVALDVIRVMDEVRWSNTEP